MPFGIGPLGRPFPRSGPHRRAIPSTGTARARGHRNAWPSPRVRSREGILRASALLSPRGSHAPLRRWPAPRGPWSLVMDGRGRWHGTGVALAEGCALMSAGKATNTRGEAPDWKHEIGVVPAIVEKAAPKADNAHAVMCGPPIMIKYTLPVLAKLRFPQERVYTTLENRTKCGSGKCRPLQRRSGPCLQGRPGVHRRGDGKAAGGVLSLARRGAGSRTAPDRQQRSRVGVSPHSLTQGHPEWPSSRTGRRRSGTARGAASVGRPRRPRAGGDPPVSADTGA